MATSQVEWFLAAQQEEHRNRSQHKKQTYHKHQQHELNNGPTQPVQERSFGPDTNGTPPYGGASLQCLELSWTRLSRLAQMIDCREKNSRPWTACGCSDDWGFLLNCMSWVPVTLCLVGCSHGRGKLCFHLCWTSGQFLSSANGHAGPKYHRVRSEGECLVSMETNTFVECVRAAQS